MKKILAVGIPAVLLFGNLLFAGTDQNPDIRKIIDSVSQDRVRMSLSKLESFETRHIFSSHREGFGIQAAAAWIMEQFAGLSSRLNVSYDEYHLPAQGRRLDRDLTLRNVMAVLPGTIKGEEERIFLVNAHYDTVARIAGGSFSRDTFDNPAPGVNDDGSGVAALIETARILSRYEFEATIYFVAFAGEETGLVGSTLLAEKLKNSRKNVAGVITLDMIGNVEGGNGIIDNRRIRVFSAGPEDSPSRQLARFVHKIGGLYFPAAEVNLIFRADRFGRGGDHTPFVLEGFPGIRVMEANENYSRQHTVDDTLENLSLEYCTRNIRIFAAVLASLASAPPAPVVTDENGRPMLGRGKNGYSAHLKWNAVNSPDLAGYKVYWRSTTSPYWENETFVGKQLEYELENLTIDEYIFGLSAVKTSGWESPVSAYVMAPRRKSSYQIK